MGCERPSASQLPAVEPPAPEEPVGADASSKVSPSSLTRDFANPPKAFRLLQYQLNDQTLRKYPEYGIGGYMAFFYQELYQRGPEEKKKIGPLVDAAHAQGATIWLADDFGYPSGMAGGKVVEQNPEYEVRGLARIRQAGENSGAISLDLPPGAEKFVSAQLYAVTPDGLQARESADLSVGDRQVTGTGLDGPWELQAFFTVIRNREVQAQTTIAQFKHTGRYPDLMNAGAVASFIANMHDPILAQISDPESKVEGFYSNEPSLGQLVFRANEVPFACSAWNAEVPAKFEEMHGYGLMPVIGAIFGGDDLASRRVRLHYQQTLAELLSENFGRQITEWNQARGLASSGHFLLDEHLVMHVANYGDYMKLVSEFTVPAIDTGIPNPSDMATFNYDYTRFTSSVADWKKAEKTMCLLDPMISYGKHDRLSPAIPLLKNSVNMAAFHGVSDFSSYLPLDPVNNGPHRATGYAPEEFTAFNDYVGRICSVLRGAHIATPVALYYPIAMFQADYIPINKWWTKILPLHAQRQGAWDRTTKALRDAGIAYTIVHPEAVADATVSEGAMQIGVGSYRYLVMPQMDFLPLAVLEKIKAFESSGGTVLWVDTKPQAADVAADDAAVAAALAKAEVVTPSDLAARVTSPYLPGFDLQFAPGAGKLDVARFQRDGQPIYFLVNRTGGTMTADISGPAGESIEVLDPATGTTTAKPVPTRVTIDKDNSLLVLKEPRA